MNAKDIWPREYYAYVAYPSRGVPLGSYNAKEVMAVSVRQEEPSVYSGKVRKDTIVEVIFNPDTPQAYNKDVNARNLIGFWDDYVDERDFLESQRKKEREERETRYEQERLERERRWREQQEQRVQAAQERKEREEKLLQLFCDETGIPLNLVMLSNSQIVLDRAAIELWLSVKQVEVG